MTYNDRVESIELEGIITFSDRTLTIKVKKSKQSFIIQGAWTMKKPVTGSRPLSSLTDIKIDQISSFSNKRHKVILVPIKNWGDHNRKAPRLYKLYILI